MVCFYFFILIPLITATRLHGPSYRSNIMEGDKPILRMSPNADYEESNSDEGTQTTPPITKDPALVRDMGLLVNWLVENFNYDVALQSRKNNNGAKPILRMPLDDDSDSNSDEDGDKDDDKVAPEIEVTEPLPLTEKPVEPSVETSVEPSGESEDLDDALRTKHKTKEHKKEESNPKWVKDLKEFIKELTTSYGQHEVLERAKPIIASLEKEHNMEITDVDGEINITYIEKGKGKKTARKGKKSDET